MTDKKKDTPEYRAMRDLALEQLRSGQSLTSEGGVFAPIIKEFLESALSAEMDDHLSEEERCAGNKRNGKGTKNLKTNSGTICIDTPQDRHSNFEPEIVKKRQRVLADSLAPKIIGLYGKGMSLRDISSHIAEMYDTEVSPTVLSEITDRVIPQVKEWQNRPLDDVYPIVWLDAMHYKVKDEGRVVNRAVYNILAINKEGKKSLIGMYISESEGAKFWLSVLTDLKTRGVKDILIACTDNLKGFSEAILSVFPDTEIQKCVIHQIRNSLKYVASKDQKPFMKDLKKVYRAVNKSEAETELLNLEEQWGKKYPIVIRSWNDNWEELSNYFKYDEPIKKLIYTTNAVEGFHRQVRKVTKTKGAFTSDMALLKLIYLTTENIAQKWTRPLQNWALTLQQLCIQFEGRINIKV
ncbi:IS256 family transposase [Anaerophaga thermohalophila]|uniref:IS256 family transposase n=1 Tax=Anaerophaga thermohalophila TaxID=177400 RepID=UPI000237C4C9|nr:IS256 family transposase [Anaerophaga thermohalophila]